MMKNTWEEIVYPSVVARETYEDLIDECVANVSKLSSIQCVLRFGGVGMPGISDIDLIFAVDPENPPAPGQLLYKSRYKEFRYCFVHGAGILPVNLANDLPYFGFYDNLDAIHGKVDLPGKEFRSTEQLRFALMVDGMVDRLLALSRLLGYRTCKARNVLLLIYSLKHTVTLCEDLDIPIPAELKQYVSEVIDFRLNWFDNPDIPILRRLAEDGFRLFSLFTRDLGEYAQLKGWWPSEQEIRPFKLAIGPDSVLDFRPIAGESIAPTLSVRRLKLLHKSIEVARTTIVIDTALAPHFLSYQKVAVEGLARFNWKMPQPSGNIELSTTYTEQMARRIEVVTQQTDFLKRHGYGTGCLHATGVLKPSLALNAGLRSKLISLVERSMRKTLPG